MLQESELPSDVLLFLQLCSEGVSSTESTGKWTGTNGLFSLSLMSGHLWICLPNTHSPPSFLHFPRDSSPLPAVYQPPAIPAHEGAGFPFEE